MLFNYCNDSKIFILTAELRIPTGIATNDANAEIEMQLVTSKQVFNINLNTCMSSYIFHSLNHYVLFHLEGNFLFHQFFLI